MVKLALVRPDSALVRVPLASPAEVRSWFANRVSMVLPADTVEQLDQWERELGEGKSSTSPGWRPVGPGRTPDEALPLVAWLREHAVKERPFTFNALHREKQGGRMYPFFIDGYDGPVTISGNKYTAAKTRGRLLLSAIRRDVRANLGVPEGWSLIEFDFRSCHAAIGVALSGDEQLAADVENDIHQIIGDIAFKSVDDASLRRTFGKKVNNAMFFGLSPAGLRRLIRDLLGRDPKDGTGERAWSAWWARYPQLAVFRDEVKALVSQAQLQRCSIEVEAPSRRLSKFSAAEAGGRSFKGRPDRGLDEVWRTVFSACFRAVEGDLLDATLRHFHSDSAGGQPVLPLYDGMLAASPSGSVPIVCHALQASARRAAHDIGLDHLRGLATAQ